MNITTIGIDLAKNVFQVHAVNERGHAVLNKQLKRSQVMALNLSAVIGWIANRLQQYLAAK
jgi:hypothetical protein